MSHIIYMFGPQHIRTLYPRLPNKRRTAISHFPATQKSLVGTESGALFLLGCHQDGIASEHCFFHQDKKISAVSASQTDPNVFVSASHDGTVTLWDKRSTEPAHFIDPFNLTASCSLDTPPLLSSHSKAHPQSLFSNPTTATDLKKR